MEGIIVWGGGGDGTYHSVLVQGRRYNRMGGGGDDTYHSVLVKGRRYQGMISSFFGGID